jgi:glutaconyl-CoA/methylmalonyl-CoA decarboxylase subunit gamma
MKIRVQIDEKFFDVEVGDLSTNPVTTVVDGEVVKVWLETSEAPAAAPAPVVKAASPAPAPVQAAAPTPRPAMAPVTGDKSKQVVAPIPGTILSISVKEGQEVTFGQELATLEAMKMKSAIRSNRAGKIAAIRVAAGDRVSQNQALMDYAD